MKMKIIGLIVLFTFLVGCGGGNKSSQNTQTDIFDSTVSPVSVGNWYKPDITNVIRSPHLSMPINQY